MLDIVKIMFYNLTICRTKKGMVNMQAQAYEGYLENGFFHTAGKTIKLPERKNMFITILEESNEDVINEILELAGTWDEEDVDLFDEIIKERKNFSSGR